MTMKRSLALLATTIALVGCSSSKPPPSIADVAAQAGCANLKVDTSFVLYVRELGTCDVAGEHLTLATFASQTARANYLKIAQTFGGIYGHGKLWVIQGTAAAAVAQATKAAGGVAG